MQTARIGAVHDTLTEGYQEATSLTSHCKVAAGQPAACLPHQMAMRLHRFLQAASFNVSPWPTVARRCIFLSALLRSCST